MTDPDPLLAALARLDPTAADPPPAPGSARHHEILERAMSTTTTRSAEAPTDPPTPAPEPVPVVPVDRRVPRRTRRLLALAGAGIAAAVIAVVAVTVAGTPGDPVDPVAALTEAAATTGEVDTLRVTSVVDEAEAGRATLAVDVAGRDFHLRARPNPEDAEPGRPEEWVVVIGDQQWSDEDPEPITVPDDERPAAFPASSRAVVRAALEGAEVTDEGTDDVAGVEARHYRVELGDEGIAALQALPANQRGWFGLGHPEWITDLDVWVADDLIRRVSLSFSEDGLGVDGSMRLDYTDFGADITIDPPR